MQCGISAVMHPCMSTILNIIQDDPGQDEFPAAASFSLPVLFAATEHQMQSIDTSKFFF